MLLMAKVQKNSIEILIFTKVIDSDLLIKELIKEGFTHLCVVPCSFATGLINSCINNSQQISYIPCSSEGIAGSIANGLSMSGKKPIIIIQSLLDSICYLLQTKTHQQTDDRRQTEDTFYYYIQEEIIALLHYYSFFRSLLVVPSYGSREHLEHWEQRETSIAYQMTK